MIDFIETPMASTVGNESPQLDSDLLEVVYALCRAADDRKADDIVALYTAPVTTLSSVLILVSGKSPPQNAAIAASVRETAEDDDNFHLQLGGGNGVPEGQATSGWIVLDYGSIIVHVMTPKSRLFYNVEGQWRQKGATSINVEHVLAGPPVAEVEESEQDDPFWS